MSYTIHNNEVIDARIEHDLQTIKKLLMKQFKSSIISLILTGGFARGEGSVIIENERVIPLIDYDIVIITKHRLFPAGLRKLSNILVKKLGLEGKNFHIDLMPINLKRLRRLPFTQFNYDLKYTGKVFYGDASILDLIPDYESQKMPLETARFLLFNRMINFIYTFSYDFINKRQPDKKEAFLLRYQCLKNVLDAGTALLILNGKYSPSYKERNERFKKLFPEKEQWVKLYDKATSFKLEPMHNDIDMGPVDVWFRTKDVYEEIFKLFINQAYNHEFNGWVEFCQFYMGENRWKFVVSDIIHIIKRVHNRRISSTSKRRIEIAEILLTFALQEKNKINYPYLRKTMEILKYTPRNENETEIWENLRKELDWRWHNC